MLKDYRLYNSIRITVLFVALLWLIKMGELVSGMSLHALGVYPRELAYLSGILTAPLIHGSLSHLISNSLPLLLLGSALLYGYPRARWWALLIIWLVSGLGVWLFARESFHFGASGLTHGMFFFLFLSGILRRDKRSIALLMIAFFMYGGMLLSVFPSEPNISFESHSFGALGGLLSAWLFKSWDLPPARRYSWDIEPETDDNVAIGDAWKIDKNDKP